MIFGNLTQLKRGLQRISRVYNTYKLDSKFRILLPSFCAENANPSELAQTKSILSSRIDMHSANKKGYLQ